MIKIALESITFGRRVTPWYDLTAEMIYSDVKLVSDTENWLLQKSGYNRHIDECFNVIFKSEK